MHGAALVPAGIDGKKLRSTLGVGRLIAAQKLFSAGIEPGVAHIRVNAARVTVPNIDHGAVERFTGAAGDLRNMNCQTERHSGLDGLVSGVDADVGAVEF